MTAVVSHIENPFPITIDDILPFGSETFLYATLYVPEGTMEKYRATEGWKDFVHIVEGIPTPKCETPTVEYKNGKLLFGCATEGVEYHVSITSTGVTTGTVFDMPTTYIVKVYASKDGYEDSDEATITIKAADNNMDVNHDGRVDAQDASLIQQYVAGKVSL